MKCPECGKEMIVLKYFYNGTGKEPEFYRCPVCKFDYKKESEGK